MNDNTAKLIQALANKLGTTAEYLWGVLLRQAHIAATIDIIRIIVSASFLLFVWKLHKYFAKDRGDDDDGYTQSMYQSVGDGLGITMIIVAVVAVILFVVCICKIPEIINGYFNPEYWALDQILSQVK